MTSPLGFFAMLLLLPALLRADTIFQTNTRGKEVILHRDAILIRQDSALLVYKHFELKERRAVKARVYKGSLSYRVVRSDDEDRRRIVETWKRFGHRATVTDLGGATTRVFVAYLDFYPPGGRGSLLQSVPPRANFPVLLEGGGADELEFSQIEKVDLADQELKITLRDGRTVAGRFLMPTDQPAEARFLGITDQYDPASQEVFDFSVPLSKLKEIRFKK